MTIHISSLQPGRLHSDQATQTEAESPPEGEHNSWITAESEGVSSAAAIPQRAKRSLPRTSSNKSSRGISRVKKNSDCGTPSNEPEHVRREHHGMIVNKVLLIAVDRITS